MVYLLEVHDPGSSGPMRNESNVQYQYWPTYRILGPGSGPEYAMGGVFGESSHVLDAHVREAQYLMFLSNHPSRYSVTDSLLVSILKISADLVSSPVMIPSGRI